MLQVHSSCQVLGKVVVSCQVLGKLGRALTGLGARQNSCRAAEGKAARLLCWRWEIPRDY